MSAKFAAAALALLGLASAAHAPDASAENKPQQHSFPVVYGDLNLSKPAGGRTLLVRIEKAARKVCGNAIPHSPLLQRQAVECRREAVALTVRNLGFPALTLAWSGKYPATVMAAR
jgi:UrcA family protein